MAPIHPSSPRCRLLTVEQWIYDLQTRFSFPELPGSSNPYVKAMRTFQAFTNDVASSLHDNAINGTGIIEEGLLHKIYDDLPSFLEYENFRDWIKDATLKHPYRRTAKQYQWLCIVGRHERKQSKSKANLVNMILGAAEWLSIWEKGAYDIQNLLKDPDSQWFFRNKYGIKDAEGNGDDFGESCLICANDFDASLHFPQRAPCGHHQCQKCFQKALDYVAAAYNCPFCRACLVCGDHACQHHLIPHDEAPPYPLDIFLRAGHYLCVGSCKAMEPLCDLTPERYWVLREESRKDRSLLTKVLWLLSHGLAPEHRRNVEREREDLCNLLKARVELARCLQMSAEATEQSKAIA